MAVAFSRLQSSSRGRGDRSDAPHPQPWIEIQDQGLIMRARAGDAAAMDRLIEKYRGFVRMKASAYFLAGGENEDLVQEGLIGFFKAVRDYRVDREASFRSFAELCVTRQIITAIKTAARNKHAPLNTYVSFSHTRAGASGDQEMSLAEVLAGDPVVDPVTQVISPRSCAAWLAAWASRCRSSRAGSSRCTWRAAPTRRSPAGSTARRRRSTTPSSA
jgi:RNA polymerase sporulation-specific sigma factor